MVFSSNYSTALPLFIQEKNTFSETICINVFTLTVRIKDGTSNGADMALVNVDDMAFVRYIPKLDANSRTK